MVVAKYLCDRHIRQKDLKLETIVQKQRREAVEAEAKQATLRKCNEVSRRDDEERRKAQDVVLKATIDAVTKALTSPGAAAPDLKTKK